MKKRIIPYIFIVILMAICAVDNSIDMLNIFIYSHSQIYINLGIAIVFGILMDFILNAISKIEIKGAKTKVIYQIISYVFIIFSFALMTLLFNFDILLFNNFNASIKFVDNLYSNLLLSILYSGISILLMKSISIPITFKDLKNDI